MTAETLRKACFFFFQENEILASHDIVLVAKDLSIDVSITL